MPFVNRDTFDKSNDSEPSPNLLLDTEALSSQGRMQLEVISTLLEPCSREEYGIRLRAGADKLGVSVRTVQRLVKKWQENGLAALAQPHRADKGQHRVGSTWESFIIKTFDEGNKGGRRMNAKQVAVRVFARAQELGEANPPSYRTILRILKPYIQQKQSPKSIRSPGWRGSSLVVKTREGQDLAIEYSNHVWQCDHTRADVLLVDSEGKVLSRPWLTIVVDSYSRCLMGLRLGFDAPSSQVVALALRHAIRPKSYGPEYGLHRDWGTFGKPAHFFTDGGRDFRSDHIREVGAQLGFACHLRDRPSQGGIVERVFRTLNDQLFSTLPGYTGSSVESRPENVEKNACLTLAELEKLVVRFVVDNYNQQIDARTGDQTRFQRWEAGLFTSPNPINDRELDICLMKVARRQVQRGGHILFENITYRGEYLAGYAGETVSLRYDPADITSLLIYRRDGANEAFLTRAFALGLESEALSLEQVRESSSKLKAKGRKLNNESVLHEAIARDSLIKEKVTRKERKKKEQAVVHPTKPAPTPLDDDEAIPDDTPLPVIVQRAFTPIDFDDLQGW